MEISHRFDSAERQHYLLEEAYSFQLKPRLLYAGKLEKSVGWSEKPHSHLFSEIIFIIEGSGTVTVDGAERTVHRGDLVIYNAGTEHCEQNSADAPMEMYFFAIDKFRITNLPENHLLPDNYDCVYPSGTLYPVFRELLSSIIDEFRQKDYFYAEISQNIMRTAVMYIFRLIHKHEEKAARLFSGGELETALRYIKENYKAELTLESVARACFLNKYYLSHLFKRFMGVSVGRYILKLRMEEAARLLSDTGMKISEVAARSGFHDPNYFSRAFKKETGLSPLQYRRAHKMPK